MTPYLEEERKALEEALSQRDAELSQRDAELARLASEADGLREGAGADAARWGGAS